MNNECSVCGHLNKDESTVCENCGSELVEVLSEKNPIQKNSAGETIRKGERFIFGLSLYVFLVFPIFFILFWKDLGLSLNLFRNITFAVFPTSGVFILIIGKVIYPKSKMFVRLLLCYLLLMALLSVAYFGFGVGKMS